MKRQVYKLKAGNINRLKISDEEIFNPIDNEVQIKVHSIGLNFADVFAILGLYSATPQGPFIPGLEFSGEILEIGSSVIDFKKGDRVMGITRFGAYTDHINIDYRYVLKIPVSWNYEEGAAYLVQVLTAYYGLKYLGDIKKNQTVLIHSAAGGVGIWANRICKYYDAFTIGSVGSKSKLPLLLDEGYDCSIFRNTKTFDSDLTKALSDRSLDLIMECIGGKIMKIGFNHLGPMGRQIIYGSAHYGESKDRPNYFRLIPKYICRPRIDPQDMIAKNVSVMAFNLIYLFERLDLLSRILGELESMNLGKAIIGHRFDFEDLPEAIRFFQSGQSKGKVIVNVSC